MARQTYSRSDETFKVLSGHEGEFAREMEKDVSYFNKIKNENEPDPYPRFRAIFRAGCQTSAPVEIWLNDMTGIYIRSRRLNASASELSRIVLEKIDGDGETLKEIFDSTKDNHLDKEECHRILAKLARNEKTNEQIRAAVLARLGEISETEDKKLRMVNR
jgi:hypothetical protein